MRLAQFLSVLIFALAYGSVQALTLEERFEQQQQILEDLQQQVAQFKAAKDTPPQSHKNWAFTSYSSMVYKNYEQFENIQDTSPQGRAITDLERIVTEFKYYPAPNWEIEVEVEYEHGGVGTAMEYDGFDEFGEFESEVEAGGEVVIEKAQIEYQSSKIIGVKFGRIYVPVGLGTDFTKPDQYFTAQRHWSELSMIPQVWDETGINVFGEVSGFHYQALLTTGLNSEFFRSGSWVAGGHQNRFETVNADALAMTVRLDYGNVKANKGFGLSYYTSSTSDNRNNQGKIDENGQVTIIGLHGAYSFGPAIMRAQYLQGELDDSAAITNANKNTPGLNAGSLTKVGSKAQSWFVEAGVNLAPTFSMPKPLYVFVAAEHANPMQEVESGIAPDRYSMTEHSLGLNYFPLPQIILKAQLANIDVEQSDIPDTTALTLALGYHFSL
ncbi:MAG: hypothetical protein ACJA1U_000317 [Bermanella sp.]|jgi:hypothetical protein